MKCTDCRFAQNWRKSPYKDNDAQIADCKIQLPTNYQRQRVNFWVTNLEESGCDLGQPEEVKTPEPESERLDKLERQLHNCYLRLMRLEDE
jgi:hypothetical protein